MLVAVLVALWVVVALAFLLQPLVAEDVTPMWDRINWLPDADERERDSAAPAPGRVVADGGRQCPNCGTRVEGDYTYCGECLTPVV